MLLYEDMKGKPITMSEVTMFLMSCAHVFPSDKEFDVKSYEEYCIQGSSSAYAIAAFYLMLRMYKEAFYMFLYYVLMKELELRGAVDTINIFQKVHRHPPSFNIFVITVSAAVRAATTQYGIMEFLRSDKGTVTAEVAEVIDYVSKTMLERYEAMEPAVTLHSLRLKIEDWEKAVDRGSGCTQIIVVDINNMDEDGEMARSTELTYNDTTLSWLLKMYVIRSNTYALRTTTITPDTKYHRVIHNGRTLFLSSKESLVYLDICDGDEIRVGGVERH